MKTKNIKINKILSTFMLLGVFLASCEKYVAIDIAPNQLAVNDAFNGDGTATSAILTLYSDANITSGIQFWATLGGLEADELQYSSTGTDIGIREFQTSNISPANTANLNSLWNSTYGLIAQSNLAIGGLNNSTKLTPGIKNQLLGEAMFFRALAFFNLVNYYGDVPLPLDPQPLKNAFLTRSPAPTVWNQIISDLKEAESLLPAAYTVTNTTNARSRVNKYTATALLARAYLYTKNYAEAETASSKIITATDVTYALAPLANVFLNNSNETIFQIAPGTSTTNFPVLGYNYVTLKTYTLLPSFISSTFESGDARATLWVSGTTITKYKLTGNEYNVMFRLSEQYLIRSEARAQLGTNLAGAISDLNTIRNRAGLGGTTAITSAAILSAVANERKAELLGEGHRWFDLIRTGAASTVIGTLKPGTWKPTAILAPIPSTEITKNNNLIQNPGYAN